MIKMKKSISLILTMFLLLLTVTGCSKSRKLVSPPVDSELGIATQSVSKTKSGEKKEEKIEETKIDYWEWAVWRAKIVAYTAVAVISGYFVFQLAEGINNFKREGE
ncbi:hypothetical protein ATZ36_15840 [Candidatus Endomicrobiellum trichonymphae]|uniref:Lipoprotein n=1 Tax=Endomicrobium trichonymphae TaxID=1408204 RepID=A0A1E5IL98_ENDTX|nr:hypothetical protein ATZ36_15840 [Candidatus Endomicrobium trichonymphae]